MKQFLPSRLGACSLTFLLLIEACAGVYGQERKPGPTVSVPFDHTVGQLVGLVRGKAKVLQGSSGMRLGFQSFLTYAATSRTLMSFPCPFLSISQSSRRTSMGALPTRRCNNCGICAKASFCERRQPEQAAREALKRRQCPGVRLRRGSGGAAEFCAGHALWGCPLDSERRCRPSRALLDLK